MFVNRRTRRRRWPFCFVTVETFGDQSRGRRLSHAPGAGKKIRMMQPIVLERVLERTRQNFLTGYICKRLRTPLSGDDLIGHGMLIWMLCF